MQVRYSAANIKACVTYVVQMCCRKSVVVVAVKVMHVAPAAPGATDVPR